MLFCEDRVRARVDELIKFRARCDTRLRNALFCARGFSFCLRSKMVWVRTLVFAKNGRRKMLSQKVRKMPYGKLGVSRGPLPDQS